MISDNVGRLMKQSPRGKSETYYSMPRSGLESKQSAMPTNASEAAN